MPLPALFQTGRTLYDVHNPQRLIFEEALRNLFPEPERVFFSIKKEVYALGRGSLQEYVEKYRQQRHQTQGCVCVRGGTVFFSGKVVPLCEQPTLHDYIYYLELRVSEHKSLGIAR
jgi:hypothetical protein